MLAVATVAEGISCSGKKWASELNVYAGEP